MDEIFKGNNIQDLSDDLEFSKVKEELDAQNETELAQTEIAPNPETFECNYSISSNISASLNNKNGVDNAQIDTAQNVDKKINNNAENAQNSVQTTENDKNVAQNDNNTAKVVNNTAQNVDNSNSKKEEKPQNNDENNTEKPKTKPFVHLHLHTE